MTPDPSSQLGIPSSPPPPTHRHHLRTPLSSIPILRPQISGEKITIGRSSVRCSHAIPQQWLNLHISRVHVVISYVSKENEREETGDIEETGGGISVECRGINPIFVDTRYETYKLERGDGMVFREDVKVNVAGYVVIVEVPMENLGEEEGRTMGLPELSPPVVMTTYTEPEKKSQTIDRETSLGIPSPTPIPSQQSPSQKEEIQIYQDTSESHSSLSPPPEIISPASLTSRPPTDSSLLDALLTTLIFAEVKPTPLPRLVADLTNRLSNVPTNHIKYILEQTACVGIVHRSGKDAAGKELSDEYYYIAESTPP